MEQSSCENNDGRSNLAERFSALIISDPRNVSPDECALVRIHEREQEILQLRKHLAEYSAKEAQIQSEKQVLEKRISLMRSALDQQQQGLVDATTKAIAYRQDILEENVRLSYALQSAQEETMTFVSSLVPLLADFSPHPRVSDAQSIVSDVRLLFRHYKESLAMSESKLRQSQFQLAPQFHVTNIEPPQNSTVAIINERKPVLTSSTPQPNHHARSLRREGFVAERDRHGQGKVIDSHFFPSISEVSSSSSLHELNDDDQNDDYFYDDEDDDDDEDVDHKPLPAIEGLQIIGEAHPGHELQASGYSKNGTTHCSFEWIRHLADGSVTYIEGAKQPTYFVSADDVDTYLAVEVQPLDDKQRKGELVKCFANDHRKISCHPEMRHYIEKSLDAGYAVYRVALWEGSHDTWEPALLEIKLDGYSIKVDGQVNNNGGFVVSEKFTTACYVCLPYEIHVEFWIVGAGGVERYLRANYGSKDVSCSRDTIVLTMRLFIKRACERKNSMNKKKKRVLFFSK